VEIPGNDTLINATPIGMTPGDGIPMDVAALSPDILVIDVIHKPETTPFLDHARAIGCQAYNGMLMLNGQAEELAGYLINGARR
jgi:shikimate dehydrogenase